MGRIPISDCDICRHLSSHNYADLRSSSIPENLAVLVGSDPSRRLATEFIDCPTCGTLYLYTYDCGFGENDITLRRATPTEAGRETDLENCRKDLASTHDETRGYAAQCLTEYYLENGGEVEAGLLLAHPDEIVRSGAEASKRFHLHRKDLE
jgi:hypothetical protein